MQLYKVVQEDDLSTLLNLLNEKWVYDDCKKPIHFEDVIRIFPSAYATSFDARPCSSPTYGESVFLERTGKRNVQRIVTSSSFYGTARKRFDVVMIENDEDTFSALPENLLPLWFAKTLCFLKLSVSEKTGIESNYAKRLDQSFCCSPKQSEYCFVQYFKILCDRRMKMDAIDIILNCVCLRWLRTAGEKGHLAPAREFGLVSVNSIREVVQIVRKNSSVGLVNQDDSRAKKHFQNCQGVTGLENDPFYVNRFYVQRSEEFEVPDGR